MKILRIIWAVFVNLVALLIFINMLRVAHTSFQTVAISGLALIYTALIFYGVAISRGLVAISHMNTNQFVFLSKLNGAGDREDEIAECEESTKELWANFQDKESIYYVNMGFLFVIWLVAVGNILNSI